MKKRLLLLVCGLICISSGCSMKEAKSHHEQADLALRQVRSETEDFKYQINSIEIEMQVLAGKLNGQEADLADLREQFLDANEAHLRLINEKLFRIEEKLTALETKDNHLNKDLLALKNHASDTHTSLSQFKAKIEENEKLIKKQSQYIENLKSALSSLVKIVEGKTSELTLTEAQVYIVQPGDSLERIAKEHQTTVDHIKQVNNLNGDLIVVGQKLRIP